MITFLQFTIYALCLAIFAVLPFAQLDSLELSSTLLCLATVCATNLFIGSRLWYLVIIY